MLEVHCTFPRLPPDGRYLLCVLCDRTTFTVYQEHGDCWAKMEEVPRHDALNSDCMRTPLPGLHHEMGAGSAYERPAVTSARSCFGYFDAQGREHKPFSFPFRRRTPAARYVRRSCDADPTVKGKVTIDP